MSTLFGSFVFLGLFIGILYSETSAKSFQESRYGDTNFNFSCLLFDDNGCNIECTITGHLFDFGSHGECIGKNSLLCYCYNHNAYGDPNPYRIWRKKFDSEYVYNRIMKTRSTTKEALKILDNPLATGEQLKEQLKPILSPYQYSKLKLNDQSPAAGYIKKGKVDEESVRKFIADELDTFFKPPVNRSSPTRSLLTINYLNRFKNALRNIRDKGTLYNFAYKVAQLGNKALENALEEYLKKNDIEKPEINLDEELSVEDIRHHLAVKEFIKRNDDAKSS